MARAQNKRAVKRARPATVPVPPPEPPVPVARGLARSAGFDAEVKRAQVLTAAMYDVRVSRRGVAHAEQELARSVERARAAGVSWRQVGLALNMTGRGAQRKFGGGDD